MLRVGDWEERLREGRPTEKLLQVTQKETGGILGGVGGNGLETWRSWLKPSVYLAAAALNCKYST